LGVSAASVVRWSQRLRTTGSAAPARIGGYVRPKISGPHRDWLIERAHTAAFTLRGLVVELAERGLQVDYRTVWKFVHRERLSFKKKRAGQRAGPSGRSPQTKPMAEIPEPD
jgi:putative transposase